MLHRNDESTPPDCDCEPQEPRWLTLAVVVLPAVLPIVFERVADAIVSYFDRKREQNTEEEEEENDEQP